MRRWPWRITCATLGLALGMGAAAAETSADLAAARGVFQRNLDAIRAQLETIAKDFAAGRFEAPLATHGEVPPGVPAMLRLRGVIVYRYEPLTSGGHVRILAATAEAVDAVHAFLRYQIREHRTGDPG